MRFCRQLFPSVGEIQIKSFERTDRLFLAFNALPDRLRPVPEINEFYCEQSFECNRNLIYELHSTAEGLTQTSRAFPYIPIDRIQ